MSAETVPIVPSAAPEAEPAGLEEGFRPAPERGHRREAAGHRTSTLSTLAKDPSLRFTERGRFLLRPLSSQALPPQGWDGLIGAVPKHSAGLVSQVARGCADARMEFAGDLERRATSSRGAADHGPGPV